VLKRARAQLIDILDVASVGNLMPNATKHTSILGLDIEKFDKAECSVK